MYTRFCNKSIILYSSCKRLDQVLALLTTKWPPWMILVSDWLTHKNFTETTWPNKTIFHMKQLWEILSEVSSFWPNQTKNMNISYFWLAYTSKKNFTSETAWPNASFATILILLKHGCNGRQKAYMPWMIIFFWLPAV